MIPTILPELVQIIREGQERSSDPTAEDTLIKNASDTSAKTQQSGKPKKIVMKKGKTDPHL